MIKVMLSTVLVFSMGFICGGYLFSHVQPRPFLEKLDCHNCGKRKELAGYLASLGYQFVPALSPNYIDSTDKCVVIEHINPISDHHYVLFPRKDIKDIADVTDVDIPYLIGCIALIQKLVHDKDLKSYKVFTNGPEKQDVRMLHFHLVSDNGAN